MNWKAPSWLVPFGALCVVVAFFTAGSNNGVLVWPGVWIFLATLVVSNIDKLESFKASTSGVEFEARKVVQEAKNTVAELQLLAKQVAQISLALVKRSARLGGFPAAEEEDIKDNMLGLLRKTGVSESEFPAILDQWNRWVLNDYVLGILGNHYTPEGLEGDARQEWDDMRRSAFGDDRPSADQLQSWLERNGFLDDQHREFVLDYAHYLQTGTHRRFDVWAKRFEWPRLVRH